MRPALLALLRCPVDGTPLEAEEVAHGETEEGRLRCANGHDFAVRGGIPRLSPPESAEQAATGETFSAKWAKVADADKRKLDAQQFRWYDERYGWGDEAALAEHLSRCERVVDAGCGLGYDAARYARLTEGDVVAFDLADTVEIARRDHGAAPNLHLVQGDILAPPLPPVSFDFVVADQVIHHTPDTPRAFGTLARLVRPGGQLAVYVYRRKGLLRELADDELRRRTTAMSIEECMEFSEQVTEVGRELSRARATVHLEHGVPLLGIPPGDHDVQRLVYWYLLKCYFNEDHGDALSTLVNFDWYHPPYASRHTEDEVRGWCAAAGLDVVHLDVVESGISVRAERRR